MTEPARPGAGFRAELEVLSGPQKGCVFDVHDVPVRIGRDRACEVSLADPESMLSATHVRLDVAQGRAVVVDQSLNGTEIRRGVLSARHPVPKGQLVPIEDGDVLVLTKSLRLRFRLLSAPAAAPVPPRPAEREAPPRGPAPEGGAPGAAAPAPAAPAGRGRLVLLAIVAFWALVFAAMAGGDPSDGASDAEAALIDQLGRGDARTGTAGELAGRLSSDDWKDLRERVLHARLLEGQRRGKDAARIWTSIALWARERARASDDAFSRLARAASRRAGRSEER